MQLKKQSDVLRLPKPNKGEALFFDTGKDRVTGLALRIRAAGSHRFMFFYRLDGKQQRIVIGDATAMDLDIARKKARGYRVAIDNGDDPTMQKNAKRTAAGLTVARIVEQYLAVRTDMRPRALIEITRHLQETWKPLHSLPLASVTRPIVAERLREVTKENGPVGANRARSSLSRLYSWAVGEGLCNDNPVSGTNKNKESTRDRVLSDAELVKIWLAAPDGMYGRIVKGLMRTGQRRDEICSLQWSEFDLQKALLAFPGERTKNHRPHDVPLSALAISVLEAQPRIVGRDLTFGEGKGGYSGWSRSKEALDAACGVKDWTLHDLRRTAATRMADLGVQPHIVEAALNHVSGHKGGIAGIYNRAAYAAEKRAALDLWASHLQVEIAKATGGNVTNLEKKSKR